MVKKSWSKLKKKLRKIERKLGITLVEFVIGVAIMGIMSMMGFSIYFANFRLFTNQSVTLKIANENRIVLREMASQIREALSVSSTCAFYINPTYPYSPLCPSSGNDQLVIALQPIDGSGNPLVPSPFFDYVAYYLDSSEPGNIKFIKEVIPKNNCIGAGLLVRSLCGPITSRQASMDILTSNVAQNNLAENIVGLEFIYDELIIPDTNTVTTKLTTEQFPETTKNSPVRVTEEITVSLRNKI